MQATALADAPQDNLEGWQNTDAARTPYSRASVRVDRTASNDQSVAAVAEREDGTSSDGGVSAFEETVLGTALVGTGIFLL